MTALEVKEQGQLVSGDTSPRAVAHCVVQLLDLAAPGTARVLRVIDDITLLLCRYQGSEVAAVEGADRPGRRCRVGPEDLPGDVGGNPCGGIVQITRGQGRSRDAPARLGVFEVNRHSRASPGSFPAIATAAA